jgi:ABC-type dipeptide/oligopeptide/nickel transport system permease component
MEVEVEAEAKDKRLNRAVALSVVLFSICMGLGQVKDGNIVQSMAQAQARAVDTWSEYQATRTKLHIDETALASSATPPAEQARLGAQIAKYQAETVQLRHKATGFEQDYDAYNVHDDQFDASDATIGIAVAIAAVAALTESWAALIVAWLFGAFGLMMSAAGFLGWALKSPLATLLS